MTACRRDAHSGPITDPAILAAVAKLIVEVTRAGSGTLRDARADADNVEERH